MRPTLKPTGHRIPRTKPTCLLHTWRPHRQRPFVLVVHLHQHESSCNLHLQCLAKNQSTQRCQSLITQGSDHPPVLEWWWRTPGVRTSSAVVCATRRRTTLLQQLHPCHSLIQLHPRRSTTCPPSTPAGLWCPGSPGTIRTTRLQML
jgi:hypothetical protein